MGSIFSDLVGFYSLLLWHVSPFALLQFFRLNCVRVVVRVWNRNQSRRLLAILAMMSQAGILLRVKVFWMRSLVECATFRFDRGNVLPGCFGRYGLQVSIVELDDDSSVVQ
jgi:hypothetical protein